MALEIRQDQCDLDLLSLGALVHRLDPGTLPFRRARSFEIHVFGRRIQRGSESGQLLWYVDWDCHGNGQ